MVTNLRELQLYRKMIGRASLLIYPRCQWTASCFNALCDDDFPKHPACTEALLDIIYRYQICSSTRYQIHGQTSYTMDVISIDGQTPSLLDESKSDI